MSTAKKAPFSSLDTRLPLPALSAPSPFADVDPTDVPPDAPEGSYTYALVQSSPDIPAEQCELDAAAVEIVIRWGKSTLHVAHLAPPRSFLVGEATDKGNVDFELPADRLGVARLPVVRKAADGAARVVIPAGAVGTATLSGQIVKVSELAAHRHGEASAEVPGAIELPLHAGSKVRFEIGGIELEIARVNAGRKVSGRLSLDRRGLPFQAVSMALHLGLLGAAAVFMPPLALASEDALSHDQIDSLRTILSTTAEPEPDASKELAGGDKTASHDSHPAQDQPGRTSTKGGDSSPGVGGRGRTAGAGDNALPAMSREEMIGMARAFGINSLLKGLSPSPGALAWNDPSIAGDPKSAALWSGAPTETSGGGGLDLTGVGDGNGGDGRGIDLDRTGMFGPPGGLHRFGPGGPGLTRGHRQADLSMRPDGVKTSSRIPQELVQRVVRQSFGRFRGCYEAGLRGNPALAGRVSVRFVIGRDGGVMSAANGGSDLPDPQVISCVVAAFRGLQFPQSEDAGAATVVYPIVFSPAR